MIARAKQTALGLAVVLLGLVIPTATGFSDIGDRVSITLKSGATYTGTIVAESASEISVLTEPDKIKVTIPKDLIAEIKILEPKREGPKAPETAPGARQYMISLLSSSFSLALTSDKQPAWGFALYGRVGLLTGLSVGAGFSYASTTDSQLYQNVQAVGNIKQYLTFLTGGATPKGAWSLFGILGLYAANVELHGSADGEPECSWHWDGWKWNWVCYRTWLMLDIYVRLEGLTLGLLSEYSITQSVVLTSGWWVVVSPTSEGWGSLKVCKEGSGCSAIYFSSDELNTKPAGIITGYMIGIGVRW